MMNLVSKLKDTFSVGYLLIDHYKLIHNPNDLERILRTSNYLLERATQKDLDEFVRMIKWTPEAVSAVEDRYRIEVPVLDDLLARAPGTFGREFGAFLKRHDLNPAAVRPPDVTDDLTYLAAHFSETHDIWHFMTGFEPHLDGEAGVAAFSAAQTGSPLQVSIVVGALLNGLRLDRAALPARMRAIAKGWQMGEKAYPFLGFRWDQHWDTPLDELRKLLRLNL